ncbi:Vta1p [Sugiyamaella lignohabitans]|uniref:Vta1p n=1 Tax=Sugiyamaella lignohabitans TaxID=796027 RepID=A0A167FLH1_9ASCO|nr:Vta1p [Sugiyamaella lignohabitans]ANB15449.1 Vta1p [Sugiyamaella lignohabitans]
MDSTTPELPPIPNGIKFIQSLMSRAAELATHDPIMSYYCKLHAVQQILATNLHLEDSEVENFATALLDNIEAVKSSASENTAAVINDDVTGEVYVENFALKIFDKADKDVRNKTTVKTTASTFLAAATFLDILKVFQSPLDTEIAGKIKYAKYHATRIIKAFKAGEDPNEYDAPEDVDETQQELSAGLEDQDNLPTRSEETVSNEPEFGEQTNSTDEPLDLGPQSLDLPSAPPVLPSAPPGIPARPNLPSAPVSFSSGTSAVLPSAPSSRPIEAVPNPTPSPPPQPPVPSGPTVHPPGPANNSTSHGPSLSKADVQKILDQTEIVSSAQKHAKFAISALNYDDTATAIKELRTALDLLEGR